MFIMKFYPLYTILLLGLFQVVDSIGNNHASIQNLQGVLLVGNDTDPGNSTNTTSPPSSAPSIAPGNITMAPTMSNTTNHTSPPTIAPTLSPTVNGTKSPTVSPQPSTQPSAANVPKKESESLLKKFLVTISWMFFMALFGILFGVCLLFRRQIYYMCLQLWYSLGRMQFKRRIMMCLRKIPGTRRCFGREYGPDLNSVIGMDGNDLEESLLRDREE